MSTNPADPLTEALAQVREGLVIRPGDTLVLTLPADISTPTAQQVHDHFRDRLPEGAQLVVISGAEQIGVIRAGEADQ